MKATKIVFASIFSLIILFAVAFFLVGYLRPKPGGVKIETDIKAAVFINGSLVGETPYEGQYSAETLILRLVPEGSTENLIPFETSIKLTPGTETVIKRNFATTEDESSGYIISFEKTGEQTASLAAISNPNSVQVQIDGVSRGVTPYSVSTIAPAMHTITIKSGGYKDCSVMVNTIVGYKLVFYAKLGKGENPDNVSVQKIPEEIKMVKILETPTGLLRVRSLPGTAGEEIAQISSGDNYPYIDTDVATGWIGIQYKTPVAGLPSGVVGWVSPEYASVSTEIK